MKLLRWSFRNAHLGDTLKRVLEQWLRDLRDANQGVDFAEYFTLDPERNTISFYHPALSPSQRGVFIACVNSLLERSERLKVVVVQNNDYGRLQNGCSFALRFKRLGRWHSPPESTQSLRLEQELYSHGVCVAKALYDNLSRPANEDPFVWRVVPVVEISAVWVKILPTISDYPSLKPEYAGWMEQEIAIIQDEFPNPKFRAARFIQHENEVQILFDFLGGQSK